MDLISRQAAIDALIFEGRGAETRYFLSERIIIESDAIEAISMLPSVDKKGKWLDGAEYKGFHTYYCSECRKSVVERPWNIEKYKYCFHCGAKMEVTE